MISIPLIGVAAALVACALIARAIASAPKKASKSEKADIMKQLLAKSEGESGITGKAAPVGTRTLPVNRNLPSANRPRPTPQPARAQGARRG